MRTSTPEPNSFAQHLDLIQGDWKGSIKGAPSLFVTDSFSVSNGLLKGSSLLTIIQEAYTQTIPFQLIGEFASPDILCIHFFDEGLNCFGHQTLTFNASSLVLYGHFRSINRQEQKTQNGYITLRKVR